MGVHELWLSDAAWPQYPEPQQAAPSSECLPQSWAQKSASDPMQECGNGASASDSDGIRRRSLSPNGVLNGLWGIQEGRPSGEVRDNKQEQVARAPAEKLFSLRFVLSMRPSTCACARV